MRGYVIISKQRDWTRGSKNRNARCLGILQAAKANRTFVESCNWQHDGNIRSTTFIPSSSYTLLQSHPPTLPAASTTMCTTTYNHYACGHEIYQQIERCGWAERYCGAHCRSETCENEFEVYITMTEECAGCYQQGRMGKVAMTKEGAREI